MKVLVLGTTGLIGSSVFKSLSQKYETWGTVRSSSANTFFSDTLQQRLIVGIDALNENTLIKLMEDVKPDVVVNCIGLTKHLKGADDPMISIPINSLLPHRLARLCGINGSRLIHVSTDCVYSGKKGGYIEQDPSDSEDIYGKSKFLGEVLYPHAITLRTSTIGHELSTKHGLLNWFLSQSEQCKGFSRAIFSGLPTVEFARVIRDVVIPRGELNGLYHVAGHHISKYELLKMIAVEYNKSIDILKDEQFVIDRSLNFDRFKNATCYVAPKWPELISQMHTSYIEGE
jgi:dTDP-4-dehydrorhamnose reductase